MDRFADYGAARREMADTLRAVIASGAITASHARAELSAAVRTLLDAGAAAGTLRDDVRTEDVIAGLVGIFFACGEIPASRPSRSSVGEWLAAERGLPAHRRDGLTARKKGP